MIDPSDVTAVIPCHRTPPPPELAHAVARQVGELVLVDNGMRTAGLEWPVIRCARRGKGYAVQAAIEELRRRARPPRAVLFLDCDGQHPPDAIPDFIAAAERADLVIGSRYAMRRAVPLVRRLSNGIANAAVSARTHSLVPDSQCGMRLLHGRALYEIPFPGGAMESETRHLVRCLTAGLPVGWVSIPAIYHGEPSSFRAIRDSLAVMRAAIGPSS